MSERAGKAPKKERTERLNVEGPRDWTDEDVLQAGREKIDRLGDVAIEVEIRGRRIHPKLRNYSEFFLKATVRPR